VRGIDRIYVVSNEYKALTLAQQLNWETILESEQISESHSVDTASRYCEARDVRALLRLPIDIPLATAADIESIFAKLDPAPSAVIVPSRDGTGTNALLRSPPTLFSSHFGPNSFALHIKEAERAGAKVKIVRNEQLALDIDDAGDLREVAARLSGNSATSRWIRRY
jgi:2-phospho-L-lactate guanylyltransferase